MELGIYNGKFAKKDILGFKKGKLYIFSIDKKPNSCYNIIELEDGLYIELSSEISIKQYFKNLVKED